MHARVHLKPIGVFIKNRPLLKYQVKSNIPKEVKVVSEIILEHA